MRDVGYIFIPCIWYEHLKKFVFGTGLDTPLKDYPDMIQPGDGFMNFFVDSEGHMENLRLVYGTRETGMHFDPEPKFISKNPKDIIGYYREMSDEMNSIISYGIEFNEKKEKEYLRSLGVKED